MADNNYDASIFGLGFKSDWSISLCDTLDRAVSKHRFHVFEAALPERITHISDFNLRRYLSSAPSHPEYNQIVEIKKISMLHEDVLMLLMLFARSAKGSVLEIGPYVGGSTLAIARGIRGSGRNIPFASVEIGGAYPTHPHIKTDDIFGDLEKNVKASGYSDLVALINGGSREPAIAELVRQKLNCKPVSLLFIDADGALEADWAVYKDLLAPDAIVVFDDYSSLFAEDKTNMIVPWVNAKVAEKKLRPLGVYGWGTWFGQVCG